MGERHQRWDDYAKLPIYKKLEEITGKKVKFTMGTDLQMDYSTKSYPDAIIVINQANAYQGGIEKGIADGVLLDLTDLIDEHAPNYKKLITSDEKIYRDVVTDSCKNGAIYEVFSSLQGPWYGYVMRKDLLVKHAAKFTFAYDEIYGCKIPITYDDWEQVLSVFKNDEGNKTPLFISPTGFDFLAFLDGGYGVTSANQLYLQKDGVVEFGQATAGAKEYITMMNRWYKSGFISSSYTLNVGLDALIPKTSDCINNAGHTVFPYVYTMIDQLIAAARSLGTAGYDLVPVPRPRKNASDTLHLVPFVGYDGLTMMITDKCQKPEDVIKWIDFMFSEEGIMLANYGIEGDTYTKVGGELAYTDKIVKSGDIQGAMARETLCKLPSVKIWEREFLQVNSSMPEFAMTAWTGQDDNAWMMPGPITTTAAEAAEMVRIGMPIGQHFSENIVKFIKGTRALSQWDQYIAELKEMGLDVAVQIQQAAYDRYKNRTLPTA